MVQIYRCKRICVKIMHQNLSIILWKFNYGKNSFIELVPGVKLFFGPPSHSLVWSVSCYCRSNSRNNIPSFFFFISFRIVIFWPRGLQPKYLFNNFRNSKKSRSQKWERYTLKEDSKLTDTDGTDLD